MDVYEKYYNEALMWWDTNPNALKYGQVREDFSHEYAMYSCAGGVATPETYMRLLANPTANF